MSLRLDLSLGVDTRQSSIGDSPPVFSPSSLSSLIGWWDADDTSSITHTNGAVSQWADKSGIGNHLVQTIDGDSPVTGTRTLNGRNVLDFGGVNDFLISSGVSVGPSLSMIMVCAIDDVDSDRDCILSMNADDNDFQIEANSAPEFNMRFHSSGLVTNDGIQGADDYSGAARSFSLVLDATNSEVNLEVAQALVATDASYNGSLSASQDIRVFANRNGVHTTDGAVAEIVLTQSVISSTERTNLYAYLSSKWGVS